MTNRCDITTPFPAPIARLIYDYTERRKPITPMAIEYSIPVLQGRTLHSIRRAFLNCTKQHWLSITSPSATHDRYEICINNKWRIIERIVGVDYHKNSYSLDSHGLAKAFDPAHPGIWFEPGEIEQFLSVPCDGSAIFYQEELDLDDMNRQALAVCRKKPKNKNKKQLCSRASAPAFSALSALKSLPFFSAAGTSGSQPDQYSPFPEHVGAAGLAAPFFTSLFPEVLQRIIFDYLEIMARKERMVIRVGGDGCEYGGEYGDIEYVDLAGLRPLLDGEEICALQVTDAFDQHYLFTCPAVTPLPDDVRAFITELKGHSVVTQQKSKRELEGMACANPALFLVPSLTERLLTNKLSAEFILDNLEACDEDVTLEGGLASVPEEKGDED